MISLAVRERGGEGGTGARDSGMVSTTQHFVYQFVIIVPFLVATFLATGGLVSADPVQSTNDKNCIVSNAPHRETSSLSTTHLSLTDSEGLSPGILLGKLLYSSRILHNPQRTQEYSDLARHRECLVIYGEYLLLSPSSQ